MFNSKIAVSIIISKEKVLKQAYFGKNVSARQFLFKRRKPKLQSYRDKGSSKAGLKLTGLSGKQRTYVRTRMWQIANEIVKLAKGFNTNVVIEKLRHLRKRKGEWNKKSRKKVNSIPYPLFMHPLKRVAERAFPSKKSILATQAGPAHGVDISAKKTGEAIFTSNVSNAGTKRTETGTVLQASTSASG